MNRKLVSINQEIQAVKKEIALLQKIKYKLNSQMRHFKQLQLLRIIIRQSKNLSIEIINIGKYQVQQIDTINLQSYYSKQYEIKQRIVSQGHRVRQFIQKGFLLQFSVLIFGILSKLHTLFTKVQKKVDVINKIQKQRQNKLSKQTKHP